MMERLAYLHPEIALFIGTCLVMVVGLSPKIDVRRACAGLCFFALLLAGALAVGTTPPSDAGPVPNLMGYVKGIVALIGALLVLLVVGTVDRREEELIARGRIAFDALRTNRAEFYAFFLFSLTGVMLCASATDLIWLFLALELTSLPTYIMVTISSHRSRAQEAGVKYFFLGALGAATFLYGFALLYGATGTTTFAGLAHAFATHGMSPIAILGLLLSVIGVGFKIAAVPMHFYTPDVYEGAGATIAAFLAFVPKTAGFVALILITSAAGWSYGPAGGSLPDELRLALWVMAAMTMTVGNVLAILQSNVKRILAYSSIAHSGYLLVGIIAGPGDGSLARNGLAAVLFYLFAYGITNIGAFGVLACLERRGRDGEPEEIESVDDLRGLCRSRPVLGWTMVLCSLSLLGFPPLVGFFAKVPLFTSAMGAGEVLLVIILALNSAIGAYYYLRLAAAAMLADPEGKPVEASPFPTRVFAAGVAAGSVVGLALLAQPFMRASRHAAEYRPPAAPAEHAGTPDEH